MNRISQGNRLIALYTAETVTYASLSQCIVMYIDLRVVHQPEIHKLWTIIRKKKLPTTPEEQELIIYDLLTKSQGNRTVNEYVNHILRTNSILETLHKRTE